MRRSGSNLAARLARLYPGAQRLDDRLLGGDARGDDPRDRLSARVPLARQVVPPVARGGGVAVRQRPRLRLHDDPGGRTFVAAFLYPWIVMNRHLSTAEAQPTRQVVGNGYAPRSPRASPRPGSDAEISREPGYREAGYRERRPDRRSRGVHDLRSMAPSLASRRRPPSAAAALAMNAPMSSDRAPTSAKVAPALRAVSAASRTC
jgi:hypothetical protein